MNPFSNRNLCDLWESLGPHKLYYDSYTLSLWQWYGKRKKKQSKNMHEQLDDVASAKSREWKVEFYSKFSNNWRDETLLHTFAFLSAQLEDSWVGEPGGGCVDRVLQKWGKGKRGVTVSGFSGGFFFCVGFLRRRALIFFSYVKRSFTNRIARISRVCLNNTRVVWITKHC